MARNIKIMIVDDSALVREALKEVFSIDQELEVIATAGDPYEAAKELRVHVPDVITLDLQMPRMDGLTFLKKLMQQHPIPVVVISSLTEKGKETALKALEYGAAEVITKPKINTNADFKESSHKLCQVVKAASKANLQNLRERSSGGNSSSKQNVYDIESRRDTVIALGASTGGTEAIKTVLQSLPSNTPGIVVVQHMPVGFTNQFAMRLNRECPMEVREAKDGDRVEHGLALIAPGNMHMYLKKSGGRYYVEVKDGPLVNRHMPSVDELFFSVAKAAGNKALAVLMTGMGKDGAKGLLELKNSGAKTIAQDEASCIVFGMPREAIALNAADKIVPLNTIPNTLIDLISEKVK